MQVVARGARARVFGRARASLCRRRQHRPRRPPLRRLENRPLRHPRLQSLGEVGEDVKEERWVMAFIKKDVLKKKVEAATAPEHPLLKEVSLDVATKTAYVQGCALATLLDDEKTSDSEHDMVRSIGLSLGLTDLEIEECFSSVGELSNDDEKGQFIEEITSLLKKDVVNRFFMQDFERTVTINGKASDEVCEIVDYIGALIYNATDWRKKKALEDEQRRLENERRAAAEKRKHQLEEEQRIQKSEEEKRRKAEELVNSFYPEVSKYMKRYEFPLSDNCWSQIKRDLSQKGLDGVSLQDALKCIETVYSKALKEIYDVQLRSDHEALLITVWNTWARDVAMFVCAICSLKKNLTDADKVHLNNLLRRAVRPRDGTGWFNVTDELKSCISRVLDVKVEQLRISPYPSSLW